MNIATDSLQPGAQSASNANPLWVAVGILGVAVLGMGGTMIYQARTSAPAALVATPSPELTKAMSLASAARLTNGGNAADDMIEKPNAGPALTAPAPAKKVVKAKPQPTPSPSPSVASVASLPAPLMVPAPAPMVVVAAPVCANCGSVESVTAGERTTKADGPGIGAVGGGVLGAVLGSQVGKGNGRTVATILGAIGGGVAGNAIEKNIKKETFYQVGVRMDDGSRRTIEVAQPPQVGGKVTLDGSGIRGADGVVYRAALPAAQRPYQSAPTYQTP